MGRFRGIRAGGSAALAVVAIVVSGFGAPARGADPTTVDDPVASAHLLTLANADRTAAGLPPLEARLDVTDVATAHSRRMAVAGDICHNDDYFTSESRQRLGARSLGENVALNTSSDDAHRRLMLSPGHRANLMNPKFIVVGMAVVRNLDGVGFITQDFVEPLAGARPPVDPAPAPSPAPAPQPTPGPQPPTAAEPPSAGPAAARAPQPAPAAENAPAAVPRPMRQPYAVPGRGAQPVATAPATAPAGEPVATTASAVAPTTTARQTVSVVTEPISSSASASDADASAGGSPPLVLVVLGVAVLAMAATGAARTTAARRSLGGPTDSGM